MRHRSPNLPPKPRSTRGYIVFMVIFTIAAAGLWIAINKDNIQEYRETYASREQTRQKIAETKSLITRLNRQQQSLNYHGHESKKQMRERLQMHLQGEQVVYFENEPTTSNSATQTTTTVTMATEP